MIDLEPTLGSEANKRRPAVIVSNDRANATADRLRRRVVTVVPTTRSAARVYPFQTVLGHVPAALMAEVDDAPRLHLQL